MGKGLPPHALRYLDRLAEALRPLDPRHRDAILLELRGHLVDCWERGPHRLDEALASMGEPASFARGFLALGMPNPAAGSLVSTGVVASNDPGLVDGLKHTLASARHGLWTVGLVLFCALTVSDFAAFGPFGPGAKAGMLALRLAAVVAALAAGYRLMLRVEVKPWRLDLAIVRFAAAASAGLALVAGILLAVRLGLVPLLPPEIGVPLLVATIAGCALAGLRLQPFLVGLAAGRTGFGVARIWSGMAGRTAKAAQLWLLAVLPLFVLHAAINLVVRRWDMDPGLLLGLAGIDALVATAMAILAMAINVMAFRWVAGEPLPPAEPFASAAPGAEEVERQRALLLHLLRESRRPA